MAHTKLYHTHLNSDHGRNQPLFLIIEGASCDECEKGHNDGKVSGKSAGAGVQAPKHNVAANGKKRKPPR